MSASVIIPTWQRAPWLTRCLSALKRQYRRPEEIIVVGRPEDQPAREVVSRAEDQGLRVRWVRVDRPCQVPAMRRGLEEAKGEIVAFLDDDTEPDPEWLSALLEPFATTQVACVGGRVLNPPFGHPVHVPHDAGRVRWYGQYVGGVGGRCCNGPVDVHGLPDGNMAWRRSVLLNMRFAPVFDEDDGLHLSLDLCLQALARGYRVVYTPRAEVLHHFAPRELGGRQEDVVTRAFVAGRNMTFIGLARYPNLQRVMFLLWWYGVGEGQSYGFARGILSLCLGPRCAWPRIRSAARGRLEGVRSWRALGRPPRQ